MNLLEIMFHSTKNPANGKEIALSSNTSQNRSEIFGGLNVDNTPVDYDKSQRLG